MATEATVQIGDVLVVFEGPSRIIWRDLGAGRWVPEGLWPQEMHRKELQQHIDGGRPVLTVLEEAEAVPVLRDEWARAPEALRAALTAGSGTGSEAVPAAARPTHRGDVGELRVPFLDWLPEADRERGARFLAHTEDVLARTPLALLPALLLDEPATAASGVRFARRLLPGVVTPARLASAVRHVFGAVRRGPAARPRHRGAGR